MVKKNPTAPFTRTKVTQGKVIPVGDVEFQSYVLSGKSKDGEYYEFLFSRKLFFNSLRFDNSNVKFRVGYDDKDNTIVIVPELTNICDIFQNWLVEVYVDFAIHSICHVDKYTLVMQQIYYEEVIIDVYRSGIHLENGSIVRWENIDFRKLRFNSRVLSFFTICSVENKSHIRVRVTDLGHYLHYDKHRWTNDSFKPKTTVRSGCFAKKMLSCSDDAYDFEIAD